MRLRRRHRGEFLRRPGRTESPANAGLRPDCVELSIYLPDRGKLGWSDDGDFILSGNLVITLEALLHGYLLGFAQRLDNRSAERVASNYCHEKVSPRRKRRPRRPRARA
jgi:hypothetical protein